MECNNYQILIADDEMEVNNSISNYLYQLAQKSGDRIQIFTAISATDVLAILSEHHIDILFIDYYFRGGINGDEIIDRIDDPFGNKLIILMSARDRNELEEIITKRHKNLGIRFKFLRKPFDYLEIQDKYLEIKQYFSCRSYPFPLAYARDSLLASSTAQEQFFAMKDVIESISKYCVAILLSDLNRLNKKHKVNINFVLNQNLTIDIWLSWFNNLLNDFDFQEKIFMPELLHLFNPDVHHDNRIPLSEKLKKNNINESLMQEAGQIFLCYSRLDEEKVNDLYRKLSNAGFKPWMDTKNILPGEVWERSIQKAIHRSDFFLACLSQNSFNKRGLLQKEIKNAMENWQEKLDDDIYIIPVRLDDCSIPEHLAKFEWVNLFEENGWSRLEKAIKAGLKRRENNIPSADQEFIPADNSLSNKIIFSSIKKGTGEEDEKQLKKKNFIGCFKWMFQFIREVQDSILTRGYAKEERLYATLVKEYDSLLRSLISKLIFTSRYILLVPEKIIHLPGDNSNEYEYKVRILMGAETRFPVINFRCRWPLKLNEVYIHSPRGFLLSLHPFLIYTICKKCSFARLFLLDEIKRKQIVYISFCNHQYRDENNKSIFDSMFVLQHK